MTTKTETTVTGLVSDAAEAIVDHYEIGMECKEWLEMFLSNLIDDVESAKDGE